MKCADLVLLSVAMGAVTLPFYFAQTVHDPASFWAVRISIKNVGVLFVCWLFWTSILHSVGVYDPRHLASGRNLLMRLYTGIGLCSGVTLAMLYLRNSDRSIMLPMLIFFAGSYVLTSVARSLVITFERS